jgi:hypothetical protein
MIAAKNLKSLPYVAVCIINMSNITTRLSGNMGRGE